MCSVSGKLSNKVIVSVIAFLITIKSPRPVHHTEYLSVERNKCTWIKMFMENL
jgi:hypothetical protein